jgi:hypothetical protein
VDETNGFIRDPFGTELTEWGLLDSLRSNQLTDCEVPLAVLYWTQAGGINFVDVWSVRRRLTTRAQSSRWSSICSDRRRAEADAMFLQFQDQLEDVRSQNQDPSTLTADSYFRFLPPIGFLPIVSGPAQGFDYHNFFKNKIHRDPVFIEGAQIQSLMSEALDYPPVDTASGEMVWLYSIRENVELFDLGSGQRPQPYLIFVNGHTPYRGNARYDLNRWDFSNFGEI